MTRCVKVAILGLLVVTARALGVTGLDVAIWPGAVDHLGHAVGVDEAVHTSDADVPVGAIAKTDANVHEKRTDSTTTPSAQPQHRQREPLPPSLNSRHRTTDMRRFPNLPSSVAATVVAALAAKPVDTVDAVDTNDKQRALDLLTFHVLEYERFEAQIDDIQAEIDATQNELDAIDAAIAKQWEVYDNQFESVMKAAIPSPRGGKQRELRCLGWKKTQNCKWSGPHDVSGDKSCFSPIFNNDNVGYCVVRDEETDEYFRVMRSDCLATVPGVPMSCRLAPVFANFAAEIEQLLAEPTDDLVATNTNWSDRKDGIVLVVTPTTLGDAESLVRALRALGCRLPVELWYYEDLMQNHGAELLRVVATLRDTTDNPSLVVAKPMMSHELKEDTASPTSGKIRALRHSSFTRVLYLDVGTVPLRDPTYLFSLPEFEITGAVFWPDLFHAATTQSNIQPTSLLWEYIDMTFVGMFEQDDRQLLIRRDRPGLRALRLVELFAPHSPNLFERLQLTTDGKDHFRLAWLRSDTNFHMISIPPSLGGSTLSSEPGRFCGSHVVQYDTQGRMLFVHRQHNAVGDAKGDFTYLQAFAWRRDTTNQDATKRLGDRDLMLYYTIAPFSPSGSASARCYAFAPDADADGRVTTALWSKKRMEPLK